MCRWIGAHPVKKRLALSLTQLRLSPIDYNSLESIGVGVSEYVDVERLVYEGKRWNISL